MYIHDISNISYHLNISTRPLQTPDQVTRLPTAEESQQAQATSRIAHLLPDA